MKIKFKFLLVSSAILSISIVGCGTKNYGKKGEYTYHEAIKSTPSEWNPHLLKDSTSAYINEYTTQGFVEVAMDENKKDTWRYEMADSITDITASFDQKEKFDISEDSKRVYQINLNHNAKWDNGDPINADSYIYSMKQLLNPQMKNTRASVFTDGIAAIAGAKNYFYNGQAVYTFFGGPNADGFEVDDNGNIYKKPGLEQVFYSVDEKNPQLWGMSLREHHDGDHASWFLEDGQDFFSILDSQSKNADGWSPVTLSLYPYFTQIAINIAGEGASNLWPVLCTYRSVYSGVWEDVGFYKVDEYTLIYVTTHQLSLTDLFSQVSEGFLVHEATYEDLKSTQGSLVVTKYGTSVETYRSYGPYKLVSIQRDKQIVLQKNENWYGYNDNKHANMYQTTKIVFEVIDKHSTVINKFLKGQLEVAPIETTDMSKYYSSSSLLQADEDKVFTICFNTNLDQLRALESNGVNKRVGHYTTFREAFSYAINRLSFVNNATAGSKLQFGLFNNQYLYDGEHTYRDSEYGMKVIVDHYGVEYGEGKTYATLLEAYNSVTGYDLDKARTLFQQTYETMKEAGEYVDGQKIELNCVATQYATISEEKMSQQRMLNSFINEATKDTGFANKINITFVGPIGGDKGDMDLDFHDGKVEMILAVKYGAVDSPFHQISKYVVDKNSGAGNYLVPEVAAYDPQNENITLTIDGEEKTKSVRWWANQINGYGGNYDDAPLETKLTILAAIEQYLLDHFVSIPIYSRCIAQLSSKKIEQGSTTYNRYYGYGGIAYMTYNYDDYDWSKYIEAHGGRLSYVD